MQHLQSLSLLEERIQAAVELITVLKSEKKKLEVENGRLVEIQHGLERKLETLDEERSDLVAEVQQLRAKAEEWGRFESDRDEIRARIDGMLAKFESIEV